MIDNDYFKNIVKKVASKVDNRHKIGLLSEKILHSTIKYYLADEEFHEQKIGGYYADILKNDKIYEIQTANFNKLREKLEYFLNECKYDVTIVYPIPYKKTIYWISEDNKEMSSGRLSNRKGNFMNVFPELYKIKQYLKNDRLHFMFMLINIDEYKYLNGWDKTRKKGSSRIERIPTELVDILNINCLEDYSYYTKCFSDNSFTTKDYKKANKSSVKEANVALNILLYLGVVDRIGKQGRLYLYKNNMEEK